MTLTLGIRLVIIFPTLLFLIGFTLKGLIERATLERCFQTLGVEHKLGENLNHDFLTMLAIDATFLFVANGLILIFQFEKIEGGIIALIAGLILSMCVHISIYIIKISGNGAVDIASGLGLISVLGIFALLFGEFVYFSVYEIISHSQIAFIAGFLVGILIGLFVFYVSAPDSSKYGQKTGFTGEDARQWLENHLQTEEGKQALEELKKYLPLLL